MLTDAQVNIELAVRLLRMEGPMRVFREEETAS
jgi:hypothetical protein